MPDLSNDCVLNSLLDKYLIDGHDNTEYLNESIISNQLPDGNEGLPVLMWIHGGGYRRGSASQYGVRHLVNKKTVVVTIQYRLGSLGEAYYRLFRNEDRRKNIVNSS